MDIRCIGPEDWEKLKDIRTRAITDSPQAFGDSLEETAARTEEEWRKWTRNKIYVIEDDSRPVATATLRNNNPEHSNFVVGVWTDPEYRGRGLNRQLLEQIFKDAAGMGMDKVLLHVNVDQLAALKSYQRLGFEVVDTIKNEKMGDGLLHDEYLMEKGLA